MRPLTCCVTTPARSSQHKTFQPSPFIVEELLIPRHPLDQHHQAQLTMLGQLPDMAARAYHARLFRLGNAAYRYQQLAEGEVTEDDFQHWLAGLPEKMRAAMERDGFEKNKHSLPLRRHALERRDIGYNEFMQQQLSAEDWAYEQALRQPNHAHGTTPPQNS